MCKFSCGQLPVVEKQEIKRKTCQKSWEKKQIDDVDVSSFKQENKR